MRILLVNPKANLPIDVRTNPSLGLAYMGAVSERSGHEVKVLDMEIDNTTLETVIKGWQPDIFGITANTPQIKAAWEAAAEIKAWSDNPVVIGGPHASIMPEETLRKGTVDVVVRGEGEETWDELCSVVTNKGDLAGVSGISFRTKDGSISHNSNRPSIQNLDTLPFPAYHLFQMDRYTSLQPTLDQSTGSIRSFSLMTSRGCPYRCTYCSQSIFPSRWRPRSAEHVVEEWKHLVLDLGATEIGILDDSFNIDKRRAMAICDGIIENQLNHVPWLLINGMRANLADLELLRKMKAAGCKRVAFGVESGSQQILDGIEKKLSLDEVREAFKNARKAGLETIGFFMIGLPGDTEETMEETIRFAIELDPLVANFSMTTPFPGTSLYEMARTRGRLLMDGWEDYVFFEGKARYEMDNVTAELAERKWHEAYRRFYIRPSRMLRTLARKETWLNLPRVARMATRLVLPSQANH